MRRARIQSERKRAEERSERRMAGEQSGTRTETDGDSTVVYRETCFETSTIYDSISVRDAY
jgi:hypothetical protein